MVTPQQPDAQQRYGACPMCGGDDVYAYTRWSWMTGEEAKARYSYIECDDCRTVSKNTTDKFTWEQVVAEWEKRKAKSLEETRKWRSEKRP